MFETHGPSATGITMAPDFAFVVSRLSSRTRSASCPPSRFHDARAGRDPTTLTCSPGWNHSPHHQPKDAAPGSGQMFCRNSVYGGGPGPGGNPAIKTARVSQVARDTRTMVERWVGRFVVPFDGTSANSSTQARSSLSESAAIGRNLESDDGRYRVGRRPLDGSGSVWYTTMRADFDFTPLGLGFSPIVLICVYKIPRLNPCPTGR